MAGTPERFVDAVEAAAFCGLSRKTIWRLAAAGKLPHVRPTGRRCVRFRLAELERWVRAFTEDDRSGPRKSGGRMVAEADKAPQAPREDRVVLVEGEKATDADD